MEIINEMSMDSKEWEMYRSRQMAKMILKYKDIADFTGLKEKEIEKIKNNI